jgi:hypothetical protein
MRSLRALSFARTSSLNSRSSEETPLPPIELHEALGHASPEPRHHSPTTKFRSIYRHPLLYRLAMRLAYRSEFRQRYALVADQIAEPSRVLEVCCGDLVLQAVLARRGLLRSYHGLEINPGMLKVARKRGIHVEAVDVRTIRVVPKADVVVMQASLYQFHLMAESLLNSLWDATERQLIIAEPVRNLSGSANGFVRRLGHLLSQTEDGPQRFRYTEQTLLGLYRRCSVPVSELKRTMHGRELIVSSLKPPGGCPFGGR